MLVEYQPLTPSSRALRPGAMIVLISVWPGLHVVAGERRLGARGELQHRGDVGGQVGRGVRERNPLAQRRVGVDHARRDRVVALLERLSRRTATVACTAVSFMKTSVLPVQTITSRSQPCFSLNARMSAIDLLGEVALVLALLDVRAVEPLDVALVEDRRHRLDRLELAAHLLELRRLQHAGRPGGARSSPPRRCPSRRRRCRRGRRAGRTR